MRRGQYWVMRCVGVCTVWTCDVCDVCRLATPFGLTAAVM